MHQIKLNKAQSEEIKRRNNDFLNDVFGDYYVSATLSRDRNNYDKFKKEIENSPENLNYCSILKLIDTSPLFTEQLFKQTFTKKINLYSKMESLNKKNILKIIKNIDKETKKKFIKDFNLEKQGSGKDVKYLIDFFKEYPIFIETISSTPIHEIPNKQEELDNKFRAFPHLKKIFIEKISNAYKNKFSNASTQKNNIDYDLQNKTEESPNWTAYEYINKLGISTCPICDINYAELYFKKVPGVVPDGTLRFPLDHFMAKNVNKYPFFTMDIANLIPMCTSCNSGIKGSKDVSHFSLINPFSFDMETSLLFHRDVSTSLNPVECLLGVKDFANFSVQIVDSLEKKHSQEEIRNIREYLNFFHITERYSMFTPLIQQEVAKELMFDSYFEKFVSSQFNISIVKNWVETNKRKSFSKLISDTKKILDENDQSHLISELFLARENKSTSGM